MSESKAKLLATIERARPILQEASTLVEITDDMGYNDTWTTQEVQKMMEPLRRLIKGQS